MVEHETFNLGVQGSIPCGPTKDPQGQRGGPELPSAKRELLQFLTRGSDDLTRERWVCGFHSPGEGDAANEA